MISLCYLYLTDCCIILFQTEMTLSFQKFEIAKKIKTMNKT